ncbi:hypothetical protein HSE3_gp029 [Bacillus phage vB_BceM-HSE3]|nr:hypothetical protein HSE3_gp029 [Bacillus phage vB_BceM-HSE3]
MATKIEGILINTKFIVCERAEMNVTTKLIKLHGTQIKSIEHIFDFETGAPEKEKIGFVAFNKKGTMKYAGVGDVVAFDLARGYFEIKLTHLKKTKHDGDTPTRTVNNLESKDKSTSKKSDSEQLSMELTNPPGAKRLSDAVNKEYSPDNHAKINRKRAQVNGAIDNLITELDTVAIDNVLKLSPEDLEIIRLIPKLQDNLEKLKL